MESLRELADSDVLTALNPDLFREAKVVNREGFLRHRITLLVSEREFSKISGSVEQGESVTIDSGEQLTMFRKLDSIIDLEIEVQNFFVNLVVLNGGEESGLQR